MLLNARPYIETFRSPTLAYQVKVLSSTTQDDVRCER